MAVDFATFSLVVPHVANCGKPVLLRGRHGIGKSELVYQFARERGQPVIERRASQMTEGDLMGLPSITGESTRWNAPDWLKQACDEPVILFLDEVDRAVIEVRQGIFELTDSRKLNGWHLHPETLIFAAVNGGEHEGASSYQVGEMDPAELDRWTVFDVEPTVEDWLTWSKNKVDGLVWDFINQNRQHLEHIGDYEPNKVYPSRRSWVRLDECLSLAGLLEESKGHGDVIFNLACAFVGFEGAVSFKDFSDNYDRQVTVEDILDHGKVEATSTFSITDHLALIEKISASGVLENRLAPNQIQNLANYMVTLPSEHFMTLFAEVGKAADSSNIIDLNDTTVASVGRTIQEHLVEVLG